MKIRLSGSRDVSMGTDGQADMTTLIVVSRNSSKLLPPALQARTYKPRLASLLTKMRRFESSALSVHTDF